MVNPDRFALEFLPSLLTLVQHSRWNVVLRFGWRESAWLGVDCILGEWDAGEWDCREWICSATSDLFVPSQLIKGEVDIRGVVLWGWWTWFVSHLLGYGALRVSERDLANG